MRVQNTPMCKLQNGCVFHVSLVFFVDIKWVSEPFSFSTESSKDPTHESVDSINEPGSPSLGKSTLCTNAYFLLHKINPWQDPFCPLCISHCRLGFFPSFVTKVFGNVMNVMSFMVLLCRIVHLQILHIHL